MKTYYFDYNATSPLAPEVWQAMEPFFTRHFGNPSSIHQMGKTAARALREARKQVAALLGAADDNEIIFTSGGTESNNAAIRAALAAHPEKKEIITSSVEHSSLFKLCKQLEKEGFRVHYLPVDSEGSLDLEKLKSFLSVNTAVVSLMMANNETGVLFPIEKIGTILTEQEILFHVDAVQAVGKVAIDLKNMPVDLMSLSAHKFYGPKGTGALYVRKGIAHQPLICGGSQERGRRAGTENVAGIVGLGVAAQIVLRELHEKARLEKLRNQFENALTQKVGAVIHAEKSERLPNTSHLGFPGVDGEALLFALDQEGLCASSGSACMSGSPEPSRVLKAMGFSDQEANSSLRFSFGRYTTEVEIEEGIELIVKAINRLRALDLNRQHVHPGV